MDLKWRQGFVIPTRAIDHMHPGQVDKLEKEEARRVYRNFTTNDNGRSRELVAVFQSPQDAALAVKLHNHILEASRLIKDLQTREG